MCKRFLGTVMAMALMLSCTTVASAAEPKEDSNIEDIIAVYAIDEDNTIVPYSSDYINQSGTGMRNGSQFKDSFSMQRKENLNVRLRVKGTCRIVVKLSMGPFWSTFLDQTVTNDEIWMISDGTIGAGVKVEVTLYFSGDSTDYALRMYGTT